MIMWYDWPVSEPMSAEEAAEFRAAMVKLRDAALAERDQAVDQLLAANREIERLTALNERYRERTEGDVALVMMRQADQDRENCVLLTEQNEGLRQENADLRYRIAVLTGEREPVSS